MNLIEAINDFNGVMDTDSADRAVQPSDYRRMLNGVTGITNGQNGSNVENTPGTLLVNNPITIEADSKTIGQEESNQGTEAYYLNYSPTGKHGIYRYTKDVVGFSNGKIDPVLVVDNTTLYNDQTPNPLGFKKEMVITGIAIVNNEILFTDDNTSPKAIDIPRGIENKNRRFKAVFNSNQFDATSTYTLQVYHPLQAGAVHTLIWTSSEKTIAGRTNDFINAVKNSPTTAAFFKIIECENKPVIEVLTLEKWYITISETSTNITTYQSVVLPYNFYPQKNQLHASSYDLLQKEHIDYVKYLPKCMPTITGGIEPGRINKIKNRVFQFRVRYNFINNHKSRIGAISNVYIPTLICGQSNEGTLDNYIDVNYQDAFIENPSFAWLVESVDIIVKDHAQEQWKVVETLKQEQFAGYNNQKYRFYNNESTNEIISDIDINEQYDNVPILAKSMEFAEDIVFMGGLTEGYDAPCIDAKVEAVYPDDNKTEEETFSICGIICIRNIYQTDTPYQAHQPIWDNDSGKIGWGGIGKIGALGNTNNHFNVTTKTQLFAGDTANSLRGFVMYLAGTDKYGISEQYDGSVNSALQYGTKNVVEITTKSHIKDANDTIEISSIASTIPFGIPITTSALNYALPVGDNVGNGLFFSRFEIQGVKSGKYYLRCASPSETTVTMLGSGKLDYQNTSAPTLSVGGITGAEALITVDAGQSQINPLTGRKTVFVGVTEMADMTDPDQAGGIHGHHAKILHGYLTDAEGAFATSYMDAVKKPRINKCFAALNNTGSFSPNSYLTNRRPLDNSGYTDHNGFFFLSISAQLVQDISITTVCRIGTFTMASAPSMYNDAGVFVSTTTDDIISGQFNEPIEITQNRRTHINGKVTNSDGQGLPNMSVVLRVAPIAITDILGYYKVITYPDTEIADNSGIDRKDVSGIITTKNSSCVAKAAPSGLNYFQVDTMVVLFNPPPVQYNDIQVLTFGVVIFSVPNNKESISAWKPGSDEQFGLVYYDKAHRRCAVATSESLKVHFLFYNEVAEVPETPRLATWQIFHEPPLWADHYQWVRTKNLQHGAWLQWCINKVQYVDDNFTSVSSQNTATYIELDFDNIAYYALNKYKNAVISAPFVKGDRLRFIKDETGKTVPEYIDVEIEAIIGSKYYIRTTNKIQVNEGMLVEMYQYRDISELELYYEFGECYGIAWGVFNGVCKKYHLGQAQDQVYLPFPMTSCIPATGVFKTGNAYFRNRNIPVSVTAATAISPQSGTGSASVTYYICDSSVSDFYISDNDNTGRVNSILLSGRTLNYSDMRFSDRFVQSTFINGINTFRALNKKTFSAEFGKLNKLKLINQTILYAIFHNSYSVSMYLNQSVLRDLTGQKLVAISNDIVPRTTEMQRTLGTQDPATIVINDEGDLFGYDEKEGAVWRASGNGIIVISDLKMKRFFKQQSDLRAARRVKSLVVGGYHRYMDYYFITMHKQESQDEVMPKVKICLPDYSFIGSAFVMRGYLQPAGILLFTFPLGGTGSTIAQISAGLTNAGLTVTTLPCGCIEVIAPNYTYANQTISIVAELKDLIINSNSSFQSQGQWILGNFWSIATNRMQFQCTTLNMQTASILYLDNLIAGNYTLMADITATGSAYNLQITVGGLLVYNTTATTGAISIPINLLTVTDKEVKITAKTLLASTDFVAIDNIRLIAAAPIKQQYGFTFDNGQQRDKSTDTEDYTLAFSKQNVSVNKQGWKSFYSFIPEMYNTLRNSLILFKDGELYTLNSGIHNHFFGTQYAREITYVVNDSSDTTKCFKAQAQYVDIAQEVTEIVIKPNAEFPTGMRSRVPKSRFGVFNGMLYSQLLCDETTPGYTDSVQALINGRDLQGKEATFTITDTNLSASVLRYIKTIYFYIFKN